MYDGSGLSRYNTSSDAIVGLLKHIWNDEAMRARFMATLPVGGRTAAENRNAQDGPGRHVAGQDRHHLERTVTLRFWMRRPRTIRFSMIARITSRPESAAVDEVADKALLAVTDRVQGSRVQASRFRA